MAEKQENVSNRKVFIAFLGTTDYKICNYYFDGNEKDCVCSVRHVQEAIASHECRGWTEKDKILVFLTKDAKEKNWVSGVYEPNEKQKIGDLIDEPANLKVGDAKWGLEEQLHKLADQGVFPKTIIESVDLPNEGFSESEIWDIFNTIESKIEENDEIYFDFTFGFRNLPMLGMVLLTYLKNTKNITIGEIYYGAFEKLGPAYKVNSVPLEKRNAPVLRLKSFSDIMDFSTAAGVFVRYGNALPLADIISQVWVNRKGDGKILQMNMLMKPLKDRLERITKMLQACRGLEIVKGENIKEIRTYIKKVINDDTENNGPKKALVPILEIIEKKFSEFYDFENVENGIIAARWYKDNGMIQQCITLLQETMVSICMDKMKEDYTIKEDRLLMEDVIKYAGGTSFNRESEDYLKRLEDKKLKLEGLCNTTEKSGQTLLKEWGSCYSSISKLRNDVNHAGFDLDEKQSAKRKGTNGNDWVKGVTKALIERAPAIASITQSIENNSRAWMDSALKKIEDELLTKEIYISENDRTEILEAYETICRKYDFLQTRLGQLQLKDEIMTRPAGVIDNSAQNFLNKIEEMYLSMKESSNG